MRRLAAGRLALPSRSRGPRLLPPRTLRAPRFPSCPPARLPSAEGTTTQATPSLDSPATAWSATPSSSAPSLPIEDSTRCAPSFPSPALAAPPDCARSPICPLNSMLFRLRKGPVSSCWPGESRRELDIASEKVADRRRKPKRVRASSPSPRKRHAPSPWRVRQLQLEMSAYVSFSGGTTLGRKGEV